MAGKKSAKASSRSPTTSNGKKNEPSSKMVQKCRSISSERAAEEKHICFLLKQIPTLDQLFQFHTKIGQGTFSAVFLASLRSDSSKKFAVKHLVPTCHPDRIHIELKYLQTIGGVNNVTSLDLSFRKNDTVVLVMPYLHHDSFTTYFEEMQSNEVANYMRNLFIALRHVHSFGVIHRDIKPCNFLYDRKRAKFLLIDFGLAQEVVADSTTPSPVVGEKRKNDSESPLPVAKRPLVLSHENVGSAKKEADPSRQRCICYGKARVCAKCRAKPSRQAARAGTPGFRAPEVLVRHPAQTAAVDMWSAGVILAAILAARFPFFSPLPDGESLAELITVFGDEALKRLARSVGLLLTLSAPRRPTDLGQLCRMARLRPAAGAIGLGRSCVPQFPDEVYHLLRRLLDVDPATRMTAEEALRHPFIVGEHRV